MWKAKVDRHHMLLDLVWHHSPVGASEKHMLALLGEPDEALLLDSDFIKDFAPCICYRYVIEPHVFYECRLSFSDTQVFRAGVVTSKH